MNICAALKLKSTPALTSALQRVCSAWPKGKAGAPRTGLVPLLHPNKPALAALILCPRFRRTLSRERLSAARPWRKVCWHNNFFSNLERFSGLRQANSSKLRLRLYLAKHSAPTMATPERARRTFQIVVAATKQWGIGKGAPRSVTTPSQGRAFSPCCTLT